MNQASRFASAPLLACAGLSLCLLLGACHGQSTPAGVERARAYRLEGKSPLAEHRLRKVLVEEPDNRAARRLLGELYFERGAWLLAERELRMALLLGGDRGPVTLMLGRCLLLQGHYSRVLNEISPMAPAAQRPATLALRGNAALELGDLGGAGASFRQALAYHPDSPEALLGLARIALYQNQAGLARSLVSRALATHPDHAGILRFREDLAHSGSGDITQSAFVPGQH